MAARKVSVIVIAAAFVFILLPPEQQQHHQCHGGEPGFELHRDGISRRLDQDYSRCHGKAAQWSQVVLRRNLVPRVVAGLAAAFEVRKGHRTHALTPALTHARTHLLTRRNGAVTATAGLRYGIADYGRDAFTFRARDPHSNCSNFDTVVAKTTGYLSTEFTRGG